MLILFVFSLAINEFIFDFTALKRDGLSEGTKIELKHGVATISRNTLTLEQTRMAIEKMCKDTHKKNCERCLKLLKACSRVESEKIVLLGDLWRYATSQNSFSSDKAKRFLLQLPVALLTSGCGRSGQANVLVTPKMPCDSYEILLQKINESKFKQKESHAQLIKDLCLIAESEAERERIKFCAAAVTKSSRRDAANYLGISTGRKNNRLAKIKKAVCNTKRLRRKINKLMSIELFAKIGVSNIKLFKDESDEEGDELDESESETDVDSNSDEADINLTESEFNDELDTVSVNDVEKTFEDDIVESDEDVTIDESLNENEFIGSLENCNKIEIARVKSKYRQRYKKEMSKIFIRRKSRKETRDILRRYPDIGKKMEDYARDCDVGADKWRRTGMLTFGAEKKTEKRLTFEKLRQFLVKTYERNFSIGTVVELCAKKNKRRKASERYKGAANIRYQRAWKGWNVKLNPDNHWSRANYKLLDKIQKNTKQSLLIGRDDQAGFRLDSTFTHKQFPSLSVDKTITTHTDFLNKKSTNLQITSYNIPAGDSNDETCFGVVKGSHVHEKSPSQHMADLTMLETKYKDMFKGKEIEFFRVDGASDEGPSHLEVQYLFTERHFRRRTILQMVSSRCSGDSYLNRVELQNSHLARGHSNTFIPSTLHGTPYDGNGKLQFIPFFHLMLK